MSETSGTTRSSRFETLVTILIALVSTVIALVASQAAVTSGNAAEAQHNGVLAKINLERVDGGSWVEIARNRRAYSAYHFARSLYDLTFEFIGRAEAEGHETHGTQLRLEAAGHLEESNLAWGFIDSGYLEPDETGQFRIDEELFLNDRRQSAATYQDTNYADDFAEGESLRVEGLTLSGSLLLWFISLMFLTWGQISRSALRWVWVTAGALVALAIVGGYAVAGLASWLGMR
jgi:hypothetical protein